MNDWALLPIGFLLGLITALVHVRRHVRTIAQFMDELLDDEIVAPLRKTDAPRAYRFQTLYRELLRRLEQPI